MDLSMTTATPGFDGAESLINQQVLERVEPLEGRITLTSLALAAITVDATTQPRVAVDRAVVYDYAEAMRAGAKFPPIKVISDGTTYWLIDGFHRVEAAHEAGLTEIAAEITPGTLEDAQWLCLAANQTHGLRRTNEDKRRAVMAALQHPRSAGMSSNAIAKHVGVSHTLVDDCRRELAPTLADSASATKRQCSDGRVMNTENIGGNSSSPKTPKPAKLRLVAANGSSLRPSEAIDPQEHWAKLSDAIATLADHKLSAKDLVALTPVEQIQALYAKARAACDFIYFVFEGFGKEEKAK